jgi:lysyl-tRNA synthetase, class II
MTQSGVLGGFFPLFPAFETHTSAPQSRPMNALPSNTSATAEENALIAERRHKLAAWRASGKAYPNDFSRENMAGTVAQHYGDLSAEALEEPRITVRVAGRIMLKRVMGKASFLTLQDMSGRIQAYIKRDAIGEEAYADFKQWDIGDIVGCTGTLFKTKTGELTIEAEQIRLLTKSLRPLPDKFHGLSDVEQKYRQRHVDLIMNEETRATFIARSRVVQSLRQYMTGHGFLEVETPMMHSIPGGASARPFVTHHNALDMSLYLRIAPELYLKRLVVGGFEKVFEINRNFRNEGLSPRHNPEFTMMEFYEAYADYRSVMNFTEGLLRQSAREALGTETFVYQGRELDLSRPFARLTMAQAVAQHHSQWTLAQLEDADFLRQMLNARGESPRKDLGLGALQLMLFEETTEALLWEPTFIIDYPAEVSPLARACDSDPDITERFELFIVGREIANGFSELNDPEDQARRFLAQAKAKEAGDEEAMYFDADYIHALEYGLPPTGGCGIGIDRLVMLLTDSASIRDVILFPQMRHESPLNPS